MEYKITVQTITPPINDEKCEKTQTIYEQRVDDLDMQELIACVNKIGCE